MVITVVPGIPTVSGEPVAVVNLKLNASFASTILSERIVTIISFDLSPDVKVTV